MNSYWFKVVTVMVCVLLLGTAAIAMFAQEPIRETAFTVACFFWLLLPLAIFRELFYSRYCTRNHVTDALRRRPRVFKPYRKPRTLHG